MTDRVSAPVTANAKTPTAGPNSAPMKNRGVRSPITSARPLGPIWPRAVCTNAHSSWITHIRIASANVTMYAEVHQSNDRSGCSADCIAGSTSVARLRAPS